MSDRCRTPEPPSDPFEAESMLAMMASVHRARAFYRRARSALELAIRTRSAGYRPGMGMLQQQLRRAVAALADFSEHVAAGVTPREIADDVEARVQVARGVAERAEDALARVAAILTDPSMSPVGAQHARELLGELAEDFTMDTFARARRLALARLAPGAPRRDPAPKSPAPEPETPATALAREVRALSMH